ncbi:hypothetical protein CK203_091742 [Vitis vinifera]|uniref:Protein TAR1 n=1 Tax=Vitis vinifera TaxID=29760 RepID=A0A438EJ75_VITVI|nr:hypothetical protein CK203_091742 [Vitis vinifera]
MRGGGFPVSSTPGNLPVTVFHSGHLPHLPILSGQSDRRQTTAGELFRRIFPANFSGDVFFDTDHTKRSAWRRSPTFVKAPEPKSHPRAGHAQFSGRRLNLTRRRVRAREAFSGDAPPPPASPDADQPSYILGSPIRALHVPLLGISVSVGPPNSLSGEAPTIFSPPQSLHVPWEVSSTFLVVPRRRDLRPSPFFGGATPQSEAVLGLSSIQTYFIL